MSKITTWTETQRKVRDHGELVAVIMSRATLRETGDADAAIVAKVWGRYSKAGTWRVVVWTSYDGGHCYAGAGGGLTAAIADAGAIVVGARGARWFLADHGERAVVTLPDGRKARPLRWSDHGALADAAGLCMVR